jgi:hypothetical protein
VAITDHSDAAGVIFEIRDGNPNLMADPLVPDHVCARLRDSAMGVAQSRCAQVHWIYLGTFARLVFSREVLKVF